MNIVIANNELRGGGAEKVILTLANQFLSLNHNVNLIIFNNIIEIDLNEKLKLYVIKSHSKSKKIKELKILIKKLEKENPIDLIISNLPETDFFLNKINHPKTFFCIHTTFSKSYLENKNFFKKIKRFFKYYYLYKNKNIITVSNGVKNDFLKNMHIKPKSIRTIYNPIDLNLIKKLSLEKNIIKENDYIVHVANYGKMKRHDLLLKAYKKANINSKLVLIGSKVEKYTYKLVKELEIEDKIHYVGYTKNPYPIIKNAKLLIVSSDYEGFSMVLLEALALKTVVISTDCPSGPNEILINELKNNLIPPNNIVALSNKMEEVLSNIEKYEKIKFENFTKKFDVKNIANKYLDLINYCNTEINKDIRTTKK